MALPRHHYEAGEFSEFPLTLQCGGILVILLRPSRQNQRVGHPVVIKQFAPGLVESGKFRVGGIEPGSKSLQPARFRREVVIVCIKRPG